MSSAYSIPLKKVVEEQGFTLLHTSSDYDEIRLETADVNRPGLQLAGFYNYFDPKRLQIVGRVESTYLETLTEEERRMRFENFMRYPIKGLVICHDMEPFPECMEMAEKYDRNVFLTREDTSRLMARLIESVSAYLAPRVTRHGVLVEVYGEGILITGESGIGKSEAAVELVKRGHRLIADDAVEIKRISPTTLIGSAPEVLKHYIEIRGIGVINVAKLFGIGAVKDSTLIDLVVHIEPWKEGVAYDRLGLEDAHINLLDVELPHITVPVQPGRNLAVIFEVAAMNNRQKKLGTNAALEFTDQLKHTFETQA